MKSRLFSRFEPEIKGNEEFGIDLGRVLALDPTDRSHCVDLLPDVRLALTKQEKVKLLEPLEAAGIRRADLERALSSMAFFVNQLKDKELEGDDIQDWADDLIELSVLDESDCEAFVDLITQLKKRAVPRLEKAIRRKAFSEGVIPTLKSVGTTVEIRAVHLESYKSGTPISEYNPNIVDCTAIVSVQIGLTSDATPSDFFFQVTLEELGYLITKLEAAKKDLEAFAELVQFKETS